MEVLQSLGVSKSCGPDLINSRLLKKGAQYIHNILSLKSPGISNALTKPSLIKLRYTTMLFGGLYTPIIKNVLLFKDTSSQTASRLLILDPVYV